MATQDDVEKATNYGTEKEEILYYHFSVPNRSSVWWWSSPPVSEAI